jgi:hypothetical protein
MSSALRTLITLVVLCVLLGIAALWGFSAATKPFPGKADAALCVDRSVSKGDKVFVNDVTVSVDNAGTRNGLAGRTLQLFTDAGFGKGDLGNAGKSTKVAFAQIWTSDAKNPSVRLVKAWLGPSSRVVEHRESRPGVLVVVGDGFKDLTRGPRKVEATADTTICSPPID